MYTVKGDGLQNGKVDKGLMKLLVDKVGELNVQYAGLTTTTYDDARRCLWASQSVDGLKHDDPDTGEVATPFDGAPDLRVRMADKVVGELNLMFMLAAMRAQVYIIGPGSGVQRGKALMALAEWMKSSLWGSKYPRAILELGNYMLGDSPAVGIMMLPWRETKTLQIEEVDMDQAAAIFASGFVAQFASSDPSATDADLEDAGRIARDEFMAVVGGNDDEAFKAMAQRMTEILPYMKLFRAKRVLSDLRRIGSAKFPRPRMEYQGPDLEPCRFGEDILFDAYARDFDSIDLMFQKIWLTESQARALALEEGWSQEFQTKLLGDEKPGEDKAPFRGEAVLTYGSETDANSHKEHFQVLRAWVRLANEDGIVSRYWMTFRPGIEEPATGLRSSDYPGGRWPGKLFEREVLGRRILAGRGITELLVADQAFVKKLMDGYGANAILNNVGAISSIGRKDKGQLFIAPMMEIELKQNGRLEFMKGPPGAAQVPDMIDRVERGVDERFGRPNKTVSDLLTGPIRQATIMLFLSQLADVWKLALMEMQEWADDEVLQRVVGKDGASIIKNRDEIKGSFSLALRFDPDDLNIDILEKKAKLLRDVIAPMNGQGVVSMTEAVSHITGVLFPQLEFVKPTDQANGDELEDEKTQFMRMLAGIEDKRPTDGSINYLIRGQWLEEHLLAHPELAERLDDKTKLRVMDRVEFLKAQEQQFGKNAQIGREGAERQETGGGEAPAPAPAPEV